MAVGSQQYSVTSATAVLIASVPPVTGSLGYQTASVVVATSAAVLLGGSNVSTANGLSVASGPLTVALFPGDNLYAIASSTTATVSVLQT